MKHLKKIPSLAMVLSVCVLFAPSVLAETPQQKTEAEKLAEQLSTAYANQSLAKLDGAQAYLKPIELVYEHSLGHTDTVRKRFQTLAELEQWLKSKENDGLPGRKTETLKHCQKGMCQFAIQGLLHNQLYLKGFSYAYLNGKPVLKTLYLLDGD